MQIMFTHVEQHSINSVAQFLLGYIGPNPDHQTNYPSANCVEFFLAYLLFTTFGVPQYYYGIPSLVSPFEYCCLQ